MLVCVDFKKISNSRHFNNYAFSYFHLNFFQLEKFCKKIYIFKGEWEKMTRKISITLEQLFNTQHKVASITKSKLDRKNHYFIVNPFPFMFFLLLWENFTRAGHIWIFSTGLNRAVHPSLPSLWQTC